MKFTNLKWWMPKIVCLIAAFGFWVYVMNEQNPMVENSYTIPVEVRNLDKTLVATNVPQRVKAVVRMNRSDIIKMRSDNIKAYVDLSGLAEGTYVHTPIYISVPGNGTVVSQDPDYFDLVIDAYAVKSLPATVEFVGTPPPGFKAKQKSVTPETITIAGAGHQVELADRAVISINVTSKVKDFEELGTVNVLDAEGNTVTGVEIIPGRVRTSIHMEEAQKSGTMILKPTTKGDPAKGYKVGKVTVTPSVVLLKASESLFDKQKELNLPEVDVTDATDTIVKQVSVISPDKGTSLPATATVTVEINKEE